MTIRTRFAPSPTGYLHVGGARTALFSWLYARRHGGTFVLRIEDTDRERSTEAAVNAILEGMTWLGLEYEEGPFYQTHRFERYNEVIDQLIEREFCDMQLKVIRRVSGEVQAVDRAGFCPFQDHTALAIRDVQPHNSCRHGFVIPHLEPRCAEVARIGIPYRQPGTLAWIHHRRVTARHVFLVPGFRPRSAGLVIRDSIFAGRRIAACQPVRRIFVHKIRTGIFDAPVIRAKPVVPCVPGGIIHGIIVISEGADEQSIQAIQVIR